MPRSPSQAVPLRSDAQAQSRALPSVSAPGWRRRARGAPSAGRAQPRWAAGHGAPSPARRQPRQSGDRAGAAPSQPRRIPPAARAAARPARSLPGRSPGSRLGTRPPTPPARAAPSAAARGGRGAPAPPAAPPAAPPPRPPRPPSAPGPTARRHRSRDPAADLIGQGRRHVTRARDASPRPRGGRGWAGRGAGARPHVLPHVTRRRRARPSARRGRDRSARRPRPPPRAVRAP